MGLSPLNGAMLGMSGSSARSWVGVSVSKSNPSSTQSSAGTKSFVRLGFAIPHETHGRTLLQLSVVPPSGSVTGCQSTTYLNTTVCSGVTALS